MVIIKMMGGLGNQMFQYALYKAFEQKHIDVYADLAWYKNKSVKFELYNFGIKINVASEKDINRLSDCQADFVSRIRRKIFGKKKSFVSEKNDSCYENDILRMDNVYLSGYWQTEKYFSNTREKLLEDYSFALVNSQVSEWEDSIRNKNSVSIHIRRGDYLQGELYGGICTSLYYAEGIEYIKMRVPNAKFFVFSDDVEWVKQQEDFKGFVIVDRNEYSSALSDMYLMSLCKHNIIANSSFSWWAAWLNRNEEKIVIAPRRWLNGKCTPDIWCKKWIRI